MVARKVRWLVSAVAFVAAIAVLACGKRSSDTAPAASSTARASSVAASAAPPVEDASFLRVSVATFEDEVLDECTDVTFKPPPGAAPDWKPRLPAGIVDGGANSTLLTKSCTEQFADRPVLASCTLNERMDDAGVTRLAVSRYYSVATLREDDVYMKDCLDMSGAWKAVSKDSPEYKRAAHDNARRNLDRARKGLRKLQQAAE